MNDCGLNLKYHRFQKALCNLAAEILAEMNLTEDFLLESGYGPTRQLSKIKSNQIYK